MAGSRPGVDTWKQNTTAFDRIRSVSSTLSQPQSVQYIADEAAVPENIARKHLERLAGLCVLMKTDDSGTTKYEPDPLHTRMKAVRELLNTHDRDGLIELKNEMLERIDE